ncbi:MAG TPA: hypothetical protein PKD91_00065 [Bacteroidia bacterium]|nr:hypothetical protein [Bacteroidia bacterium]
MIVRFFIIFTLCLVYLLPSNLKGQPSGNADRYIYISNDSCSIKAAVLDKKRKVELNLNHFYTWYAFNALHTTQGSYDGKLLTGNYKEFYLNNNLKQEGLFKDGKKSGLWKEWFSDGKLFQTLHWKNGLKNGLARTYNSSGLLVLQQHYRNNVLHGKSYSFLNGNIQSVSKYKNGNVQHENQKTKPVKKKKTPTEVKPALFDSTSISKDTVSSKGIPSDTASLTKPGSTTKTTTKIPQGKPASTGKSNPSQQPAIEKSPTRSPKPAPTAPAQKPTVTEKNKTEAPKKKWYQVFKKKDKLEP